MSGDIHWQMNSGQPFGHDGESINISFSMYAYANERHTTEWVKKLVKDKEIKWLFFDKGIWQVDLDLLYVFFEGSKKHDWAIGIVEPIFEINQEESKVFGEVRKETVAKFIITQKEVSNSMPKKIFLSHKGNDKPLVRQFYSTLNAIGYNSWLDEEDMAAGASLERALLAGMKESCAVVFFVTPEYKDENYLETEINYAMTEKRAKGDKFSIITLVLEGECGKKGEVPELLKQYVWKEPVNHLIALQEIIKALPVEPLAIDWK